MTRSLLQAGDPMAVAVSEAIRTGDLPALEQLLARHPELAIAGIADPKCGMARSLLHVATDYPGHFPNTGATIARLVAAGADVNARFIGPHTETPLHWAASSDDVEALDALLDAGADINAPGAVIAGGTPLTDAVAFGQWNTARRLVARGARVSFSEAAALGLRDLVEKRFAADPPSRELIDHAFWMACHGGQRESAEYLLARGASLNWLPPWEKRTPLDAARRNGFEQVAEWLRALGGRSAEEQ
jgi:ankyrin repeat protein